MTVCNVWSFWPEINAALCTQKSVKGGYIKVIKCAVCFMRSSDKRFQIMLRNIKTMKFLFLRYSFIYTEKYPVENSTIYMYSNGAAMLASPMKIVVASSGKIRNLPINICR